MTQEIRNLNGTTTTDKYGYDPVGNRKTKAVGSVIATNVFNANDQLLAETNGPSITTYSYDANGSLTSQTNATTGVGYTYAYDAKNHLSGVSSAGTTASYQYDYTGMRVQVSSGGTTTYSLMDPNNPTGYAQTLEEGTAPNSPTTSYVLGDDVLAQATGSGSRYLLADGHGSTRQLSTPSYTIAQAYNYDAYGQTLGATYTPSSPPATKFLYTGQQFDVNMQQYYLRARYYNPANGRFNQMDTFKEFFRVTSNHCNN